MRDAEVARIAGHQHNRISYSQLEAAGLGRAAIVHRITTGRLIRVLEGVFAVAPLLADEDGRWMELTLTSPGSFLCRITAACAWGVLGIAPETDTIVRCGKGGVRVLDGIRVHRSSTLEGETTTIRRIPVTTIERTLLDLATTVSDRALARAVREAVRLERTGLAALGDALGRFRGRRGTPRLAATLARYAGLPLERARSGAEIRALELLRDAGRPLPALNAEVAGEEADLVWHRERLIVEIDGGPFHLDAGKDARKQARWEATGWTVRRLPSDAVYESPLDFLDLAPCGCERLGPTRRKRP